MNKNKSQMHLSRACTVFFSSIPICVASNTKTKSRKASKMGSTDVFKALAGQYDAL